MRGGAGGGGQGGQVMGPGVWVGERVPDRHAGAPGWRDLLSFRRLGPKGAQRRRHRTQAIEEAASGRCRGGGHMAASRLPPAWGM